MNATALRQSAESPRPPETGSWDVFIAYAAGDAAVAKDLFKALRGGGSRPFLDSECLELGCDWDTELAKAQRQSLITVVLVSSKTPEAHFQREEIQAAIALARRRETRHRVIPLWIDGLPTEHDLVPYGLRTKHGIALSREVTLDVAASRIIQSANRSIGRRPSLIRMPALSAPPFVASLPRFVYPVVAVLAVRVLGQLAHDARESILGVPLDLTSYPEVELWQTGLRAAGGLITSALFDLWGGEGAERWGAPLAAALATGWVFLARARFQRASLVLLPMAAVALAVAVLSFTVAVKVTHLVVPGGDESPCLKSTTLTDRITFEVCSWLENGTELNGRRRAALEGLWGWLFASACVTATCSVRRWWHERADDWRRPAVMMHGLLGAACVLMALFLLRQAPRAYAIGAWGLKYSRIVSIEGPCPSELQERLAAGECRVWDVSAGAREQVLVLLGRNCGAGGAGSSTIRARVLPRPEPNSCSVEVREGHIFGDR